MFYYDLHIGHKYFKIILQRIRSNEKKNKTKKNLNKITVFFQIKVLKLTAQISSSWSIYLLR
jgi:hypothetical protein